MLEIGTHRLRNNVFLAPMAGVTDLPFRTLCAREGVGYAASEMISSDTTLHATAKTRHRVQRAENGLPHAVQIAGADPDAMAQAAAYNVSQGAEIIDINMGCPAKKVCNRLAGSALLTNPDQVAAILSAVVRRVNVPVTLKIRTGPCPANRNGVVIARLAERLGIAALAVHGRTRADRFKGQAEFDTIRDIKAAVGIPVIANGDVASLDDARRVLEHTCADGIMVGRAAQGNPWLFAELSAGLAAQPVPARPSAEAIHRTLLEHLQALHTLYGEYRGVRVARKHIAWYVSGLRSACELRRQVNAIESGREQLACVTRFFERPEQFDTGISI